MNSRFKKFSLWLVVILILPILIGVISGSFNYSSGCGGWTDSTPIPCTFAQFAIRESFFVYLILFPAFLVILLLWTRSLFIIVAGRYTENEVTVRWIGALGAGLGFILGFFASFIPEALNFIVTKLGI